MLPVNTIVYQCPECEKRLQKGYPASGNTFGTKLYSDGINGGTYAERISGTDLIPRLWPHFLDMQIDLKGDFDKCREVMSTIQSADFRWIKAPFQRECNQQNL